MSTRLTARIHGSCLVAVALSLFTGLVANAGEPAGGDTTTLRNQPGTALRDADFQRENVAVVWDEPLGGAPAVRIRTSDAAGTVFAPMEVVAEDSRQSAVDICGGQVHVVYARDYSGVWKVDLASRGIAATGFTGGAVTFNDDDARSPDVACAGGRLFVAWIERISGFDEVRITDSLRSSIAFDVPINLGPAADSGAAPAVAGVRHSAYVTWRDGDDIRFKRFGIGPGPGYALTPFGDRLVGGGNAARPARFPVIAAAGNRVVVAWERCGDLLARVSADRGVHWGPVRTIRNGACGSESGSIPNSAAIFGGRIAIAYSTRGPDAERVARSRNDLSSWTDTRLGPGADVQLFGYVTYPEAIGWVSARDVGPRITYIRHGNTDPL